MSDGIKIILFFIFIVWNIVLYNLCKQIKNMKLKFILLLVNNIIIVLGLGYVLFSYHPALIALEPVILGCCYLIGWSCHSKPEELTVKAESNLRFLLSSLICTVLFWPFYYLIYCLNHFFIKRQEEN